VGAELFAPRGHCLMRRYLLAKVLYVSSKELMGISQHYSERPAQNSDKVGLGRATLQRRGSVDITIAFPGLPRLFLNPFNRLTA
jgi:hypothetical protein